MTQAKLREFDISVLRTATQISALNGRLVNLLEHLNQRLMKEERPTVASPDSSEGVQARLLDALDLQKQVVAENFALIRSMLRQQRRRRRGSKLAEMAVATPGYEDLLDEKGILDYTSDTKGSKKPESTGQFFTKRQRQIIQLVSLGYSNRQIAQNLCLVEQTVKNHLYTIYGKAGISRRTDLATRANAPDVAEGSLLDNCMPDQPGLQ